MRFQRTAFYLMSAVLIVPFLAVLLGNQTALAYKCTGQTDGQQHYYKDGSCYQPVGTTCLDKPAPTNAADCKSRDTSKDTKIADEIPVKNDGSDITDWQCASGTYNATKHTCETCNAFGNCQTNAKVTPTPKGNDTTTDPTTQTNGTNSSKTTKTSGEGKCAGEKTDFFACDANGAQAIVGIIKIIVLIVSVGVGVVAVGGIVYGAIIYASAQDNQDQVQKSIKIIRNVIIGLVLYIFMVAILNYIVPGGVFGGTTPDQTTGQAANGTNSNSNSNSTQNNNSSNNNSGSN